MNDNLKFRIIILLVLLAGLLTHTRDIAIAAQDTATANLTRLAAAKREGKLYIYASVDRKTGDLLVREFAKLYPEIKVDLIGMTGAEVFNRYMSDLGARRVSADLLWSSNVDLQAALVTGGYAMAYRSVESDAVFPWANYGNSAYATAFEPVAMVYNRKLPEANDFPLTHTALLKAAAEQRFKGKIVTCDPEKNDTAFTLLTHDMRNGNFWSLARGLGAAGLQLAPDYDQLLDRISSGEALFGYNVPAVAAFNRSRTDPAVGYFYPADYTLALLQIAIITKGATNPNAAMLWLDYLLSRSGQEIIAKESGLFPVRSDAAGGAITLEPVRLPGGRGLKPVLPGDDVSRFNEKGLRRGFLLRWKESLTP